MTTTAPIPWKHIRNVLVLFAPLWGGAMLLFGLGGACYSIAKNDVWSARLPLVVREEASQSAHQLGRFGSQTELKAAQETLLEMTQNPEVVAAALRQIGPPDDKSPDGWPSTEVIDKVASKCVNLVAPKGSEFGNTEVVYLQVKAGSKERSTDFCRAMFDCLTQQLRNVRRVRADSIIEELSASRDLAQSNLDIAVQKVKEIEVRFGADLGDLRNLNDAISGDGTNRRTLEDTISQLQAAEHELEKLQSLHALLVAGADDPQRLMVSGSDLLTSQPSLQRLKDGLIDAQLQTSEMSGIYTEENPKYRAAMAREQEIRGRMQQETRAAIRVMEPTIHLQMARVAKLKEKSEMLSNRLNELAKVRSSYAKLDAEVKHRTTLLSDAQRALTDAQASRTAALSTNLVAELGPPQVTDKPIGPGGTVITAGSALAGLIFGLGAVFLIAPGPTSPRSGRRWSDYLNGQDRRQVGPETTAATPETAVATLPTRA